MKYCPECKEYLCAACIKYHLKFSATKKHTLHDSDFQHSEKDSIDTTSDEEPVFKCLFHPDRDIEIYCGDHDMVYCLLCVVKEHRQCSRLLEIEKAAEKIPINTEDDILQPINSLQADIQATRQKKEANLISLDQSKNEILKTIKDTELLIIDKVQELASHAKSNTFSKYDGLKSDIQEEDSVLLQTIIETDVLRSKVEAQVELDAKGQFSRHILQKRVIVQTKNKYDTVDKDEKKMKCFKVDDMIKCVLTADDIVQVVGSKRNINVSEIPLHKKSQREVTIKRTGDKETCSIYGICQLFDGTFILADNSNKSIKKLAEDFSITESLELESNPFGICLTGKTEIAVKLESHTILFISIGDKFIKKASINIEVGNKIELVSICNELWCYSGNAIQVYNREGIVIKKLSKDTFEGTTFRPVGNSIIPIAANNEFLYVSDLNSQVACIDREGNVWSVFKTEKLELIRRACFAPNGILFLAGCTSGNIMMFNAKGNCLGELVDGLINPDSLCYDNKNHQLIIGHKNKDTLTIITTDDC